MAKDYLDFISFIKRKLGIDLSLYKEAQMKRRITSLRDKREYTDFASYSQALNRDNKLLKELTERITINVSEFYRNPKRWDILKANILPYLTESKGKMSIWSAACSTGEEPYTIAILMKEYFPEIQIDILATDLDEKVLATAKQGVYKEQALKDLPRALKNKYFTENNGLYAIDPSLKRSITFKRHNLLEDTYPRNLDLIVCRNVLIYFTDEAKAMIYDRFSNALTENGILFVGSTEQIFNPKQYNFSTFDTFFYEKESK